MVPADVPLLVSRPALAELGAVLDLHGSEVSFKAVGTTGKLFTTTSGHVGFYIVDLEKDQAHQVVPDLWELAQIEEKEVIILHTGDASSSRTKGWAFPMFPQGLLKLLGTLINMLKTSLGIINVAACSSVDLDCHTDPTTSLAVAAHSVHSALGDDDVGTEAQSRVCGSHRSSDILQQGRSEQAHGGSLERNLESCQANQGPGVACGMAQVRLAGSQGVVCGHLPPSIPVGGGRTLVEDEERTAHHPTRDVPDRDEGGHGTSGRHGEPGPWSPVPRVRNPTYPSKNQMTQEGFWGCIRFPECRQTMPLSVAGFDPRQMEVKNLKKRDKALESVPTTRRGYRGKGQESDGSWVPLPNTDGELSEEELEEDSSVCVNTNLTKTEMMMIEKMRAKAKAKALASTDVVEKTE